MPQIKFAKTEEECIGFRPLSDIPRLLSYLEKLTDMQRQNHPAVTALCSFPVDMFRNAVYSVTASEGIYEALTTKYSDIAGATEKHTEQMCSGAGLLLKCLARAAFPRWFVMNLALQQICRRIYQMFGDPPIRRCSGSCGCH